MPSMVELTNQAARYFQSGDWGQVETVCGRILESDPAHPYALQLMGLAAHRAGKAAVAEVLLRGAIARAPADPGAHFNLGLVLKGEGRTAEAADCFQEATRCNPRFIDAFINLGLSLRELGRSNEAVDKLRHVLSVEPGHAVAAYNLGNILMDQGELEEAARCFRAALAANPAYLGARNNLGCVLLDLGLRDEAAVCFEEALRQNPGHKATLWNRSKLRLLQGDLPGAWHDFENRLQSPDVVRKHEHRPRWDGAPLAGKSILLHAEQGLGDTIQFIRYAKLVKQRGGQVIFECPPALIRLFDGVEGIDRLCAGPDDLPDFEVQAPLLSLPGIFATTVPSMPANVPYLRADRVLVERWRRELAPLGGFRIGVAWQGRPQHRGDRFRSVPLAQFGPLARMEGVRLISLQKGVGTEQLGGFPIVDLGDRLDAAGAFLDTAAIMMSLDLVIAVDSAVAHLAGALAVPVWVALSVAPDWRWLLNRDDSPWYPSMQLFRQERFGQWTEVFERMAADLRAQIGNVKARPR